MWEPEEDVRVLNGKESISEGYEVLFETDIFILEHGFKKDNQRVMVRCDDCGREYTLNWKEHFIHGHTTYEDMKKRGLYARFGLE